MQVAPSALAGHSIAEASPRDSAGVLTSLKQAFAGYRTENAKRREHRDAIAQLATLDDASLADMGIHRSQIEDVVTRGKR